MPEFDTYHALERYAKDNASPETRQAYLFLKRRTELSILWRSFGMIEHASMNKLTDLYLGIKDTKNKPAKLEEMSEQERQELFKKACSQVGIHIDPSLFKKE